MDPRPEIQALKAEIEELKEDIKTLKGKNEEFEAENRGLWNRLTVIDSPEGKVKDDIRDRIRANESKIAENQRKITANQGTITANTNLIAEYLRINAATPTEGTIRWHLSFHILSFPWFELLISTSFCKLNILWITITTKILIFLLASEF